MKIRTANPDFHKLWVANTVSRVGSQITFVALPLTAVVLLKAAPLQMGILTACGTLPYLLLGLPVGVWVDRLRRLPLLINADIGRALLLATIPLLTTLGKLSIEYLYLLAFITGILTLIYDVTEEAYLPAIVEDEHLLESNSQLETINSMAQLLAPVIAGGLVQLLTAPIAILIDSASFGWSAFWLKRIKKQEAEPTATQHDNLWLEIQDGLSFLLHNPILRPSLLTGLQWQLFGGMTDAIIILYLVEILHLPPAAIGLMYATGSFSGLVVSNFTHKAVTKFGLGRTLIISAIILGFGWLFIPLAIGTSWIAFIMIATGMLFVGAGNTMWNILTSSISQAVTPNRLLGRVNASGLFLTWGALPVGSLIGGWLAEQWGLRSTLLLACGGILFGTFWVLFSPLRLLLKMPDKKADENQLGLKKLSEGIN